jgi:hypothetical protein
MFIQNKKKNWLLVTAQNNLSKRWCEVMGNVSTQEHSQARMWFESLFAAGRVGFSIACFGSSMTLNAHERVVFDLGQCYARISLDVWPSEECSCP